MQKQVPRRSKNAGVEGAALLYEYLYGKAFRTTQRIKKRYFKKTLEKFNRGLLQTLDDGSWDKEDRSRAYRDVVLPYWEKYGYHPAKFWFELNCSREQRMEPRFIPSDLYYNELLPYINNLPFRYALQDKCSLDLRFPDVKQADTVCRRMAGVYYGPEMEVIDRETAAALCLARKAVLFIKPSLYTAAGTGIQAFTPSACTPEKILDLFSRTGANFIVQEKIRQHPEMAKLNPDSVSTMRVVSLFLDDTVYIAHIMMRVGPPGTTHVAVDGGYSVEVLEDGRLYPRAYRDKGTWVCGREQGLYDDAVMIPGLEEIRETVRRLHPRLPYFKWIGWDFTVDEEGAPVMIEFNTSPGDDIQRVCGSPLFGEMTDRLLEDFFHTRRMEDHQLPGCWCGTGKIRRY